MTTTTSTFNWDELSKAPKGPGVYAWYYRPEITNFDIEDIISATSGLDEKLKRDKIKSFLIKTVFNNFKEEPYSAFMHGELKPEYCGRLEHKISVSNSLLERIIQDPNRLYSLKAVLESSAPDFASPLYMAHPVRAYFDS